MNYTITLTDTEKKSMEYIAVDVDEWITNAATNRARKAKEEIIDKGGYIFFALYENEVVATMALLPRDNSIYELNKMAVKKELRGKGIGNKLVQFTIDFCKQKKFKSIILYSNTVLNNSIHLYKKYGFKEIKSEGDTPYKRSDIKMEMQLVYS